MLRGANGLDSWKGFATDPRFKQHAGARVRRLNYPQTVEPMMPNSSATKSSRLRYRTCAGRQTIADRPKPSEIISDAALTRAVGMALANAGYSNFGDIDIRVGWGAVQLIGQVPSYFQKQLAQAIVLQVAGVRTIINDLDVARRPT